MEASMGSSLYGSMTTKAWILLPTSSDILKCQKQLLVAVCMETAAAVKKVPWQSWKRGDHGVWTSTEPERGWPGVISCQWLSRDGHQVWGRNQANIIRTGSPDPRQSHTQVQLLQGPLTFFSQKDYTFLSQVFSVWAGRICRKICIPIQPDWPDTLPQSREFTLLSNRSIQVIALRDDGRKYLFSTLTLSLCISPSPSRGSSLVRAMGHCGIHPWYMTREGPGRLALPHKRSSSISCKIPYKCMYNSMF